MKTLLRFLAGPALILVLLLLIGAGAVWRVSNSKLQKKHEFVFTPGRPAATSPAVLEQGKHLAETRGCVDCHGKDLAGHTIMNNGAMGRIDGPNLTHGKGGLPVDFSDANWERAIRHGIAPDGRGLYLMPSEDFAQWSAEDMGALIAYLKSLPPVDREQAPIALGPVARALVAFGKVKLAADKIDHSAVKPMETPTGITAEYGRYVAIGCSGCHRSNFAGGKIAAGPPHWPPAANLTPSPGSHMAQWSEQDFINTIRTATRPDGTTLDPAMPRAFGQMTDTELKALWLYFKALPAAPTGSG